MLFESSVDTGVKSQLFGIFNEGLRSDVVVVVDWLDWDWKEESICLTQGSIGALLEWLRQFL